MLSKTTVLYRNADILVNEVDGETVMMSVENGSYYGMNATGNFIWKMLEAEKTTEELLNSIAQTFSLSQEQCENEVMPFIQKMMDEKILLAR